MQKNKVRRSLVIATSLTFAMAGCSGAASVTRGDRSARPNSPTTATVSTRILAVTVPNGPDQAIQVTVPTTTTTIVITKEPEVIPTDLLFAFDSAMLSPEAAPALAAILAVGAGRVVSIRIEGHTDGDGSDSYNQDLSLRRAQAVADWAVSKGVPAANITVIGWGEAKPVAPNTSSENKAKNRFVAITLTVTR